MKQFSRMLRSKVTRALETSNPDDNASKRFRSNTVNNEQLLNNPQLIDDQFIKFHHDFNIELKDLKFTSPVAYVYNPLEYAFDPYEQYVRKYCTNKKKLLFVGMNPGPFGMCQTGVPFGEIKSVREWLGIANGIVNKPEKECPTRPINGFQCKRSEESGSRLWHFFKHTFTFPERFFQHAFVYNYCPLAFMKQSGVNITPSDLKDPKQLEDICNKYYLKIIELLQPEIVVCIGKYVEKRTTDVLKANLIENIQILYLLHPSPLAGSRDKWFEKAESLFKTNNLMKFFQE